MKLEGPLHFRVRDGGMLCQEIELLAMLQGLQLCAHMGIGELILKSDSMLMVKEIKVEEEL